MRHIAPFISPLFRFNNSTLRVHHIRPNPGKTISEKTVPNKKIKSEKNSVTAPKQSSNIRLVAPPFVVQGKSIARHGLIVWEKRETRPFQPTQSESQPNYAKQKRRKIAHDSASATAAWRPSSSAASAAFSASCASSGVIDSGGLGASFGVSAGGGPVGDACVGWGVC